MRWLLILFGILDGVLFIRGATLAFHFSLPALTHFDADFWLFLLLEAGRTLFFLSLPFTSIGILLAKKWAFILSYAQFPLRFVHASFTFGVVYSLAGLFPHYGPSMALFTTGIAGLLELGRLGVIICAHRRVRKWGTIQHHERLSRRRTMIAYGIGVALFASVAGSAYYILSGRIYSSVHTAILYSDYPAVQKILTRHPEELNRKDQDGQTPLHLAVWLAAGTQQYELVTFLLQRGALPNIVIGDTGETPLHRAAGDPELTELLLAHDADSTAQDLIGRTPLHRAIYDGNIQAVRLLLAHNGAALNARDTSGETPLYAASAGGHFSAVKFLLSVGANPSIWTHDAMDALMAAVSPYPSLFDDAGIEHLKIREGIARLLLKYGAGKNYAMGDTRRVFECARRYHQQYGREEMLTILKEHGLVEPK